MTNKELEKAIENDEPMTPELAVKLLSETGLDCMYEEKTQEALDYAIDIIESQRWIPVSEGLPKHNKDVLVVDGATDVFVAWYECDESKGFHEGWHSTDDKFDYNTPIIAWIPLPESY